MSRTFTWMLFAAAAAAGSVAHAAGAPCDAPGYRDFDFWIGEWNVYTPDGKLAGSNAITREYDGCVIHERYTTPRTYRGESLNTYEPKRQVWHQTWMDNAGTLLLLEGRFADGKMMLEGQTAGEDGKAVKHRITWSANPDGSVRQFWQQAKVGSSEWTTAFDGTYRRK